MLEDISFRSIRLEDKKLIEEFTINSKVNICDFAFSNLYGWSDAYGTNIAVFNNSLSVRFNRNSHNHPLYLPVLSNNIENRKKAIQRLIDISTEVGYPLTFMCVTPYYHQLLEEFFPGRFSFCENRDGCDYLYFREKLCTLSGKKLQSKRNHINKFEKLYPNYKVLNITNDIIDKCIKIEEEWLKEHDKSISRIAEKTMINKLLSNKDKLNLLAVAIEVEGKIIAFSLGSIINHNTFGVHVEKANTNYEGAFTLVNREFAMQIPEKFIYVNREEDMGIEGLRKAKLSYKPEELLCKKIAVLKD